MHQVPGAPPGMKQTRQAFTVTEEHAKLQTYFKVFCLFQSDQKETLLHRNKSKRFMGVILNNSFIKLLIASNRCKPVCCNRITINNCLG